MKTQPFWTDDYPHPADFVTTSLPTKTEVLVVGAGFTGLNAARVLASDGAEVVVVDTGPVGAGASSVNGGMVNYGLKAATATVFKQFGPSLGRRLWDASLDSIDLVEHLVSSESIDCSFTRGGAAELGYHDRDREHFARDAGWMEEHLSFKTRLVSGDDMAQIVDSPLFTAALVDDVGAGLHPAKYVYGLARAAAARGARIVENTPVRNIARHTAGYQVLTAAGKITAQTVVLATNGYTEERPVPKLRRRVIPIGSYIVVTEPLSPSLAEELIPGNRMLWTSRRFLNYFRRTPDNRILMGGRNDLSVDLDLVESGDRLAQSTRDIFPQLEDVKFTHSWSGKLGITFDLLPHIGRIEGMWYALGYGGHGVGISTYVGTELGKLLTGEVEASPFIEIPHPTRFFYRKQPWFLPFAARWYRFLDKIGR